MIYRWVQHGEDSLSFRVASWREQRADEADANIARSNNSQFMAFVTNKSVHNRRKFAQHLRKAVAAPSSSSVVTSAAAAAAAASAAPSRTNEYTTVGFLRTIYEIVDAMHSPCMRLELLQYILGLDNRYSVSMIKESIKLAATCLSLVS